MTEPMLRHAAWLARTLGRGELSLFSPEDMESWSPRSAFAVWRREHAS
jgi:hypothetical protein